MFPEDLALLCNAGLVDCQGTKQLSSWLSDVISFARYVSLWIRITLTALFG